jgi:hypothetical protein
VWIWNAAVEHSKHIGALLADQRAISKSFGVVLLHASDDAMMMQPRCIWMQSMTYKKQCR